MEKTLRTLQGIAKAGKIISRIVFVFSIIGVIFCLIGIAGVKLLPAETFIGSVSVTGIETISEGVTVAVLNATLVSAIIMCVFEAFLASRSISYFKYQLNVGTPFTLKGAKKLKTLGIMTIVLPLIGIIVSSVAFVLIASTSEEIVSFQSGGTISIGTGIMFLIISVLCKYGAQISEANGYAPQAPGSTFEE